MITKSCPHCGAPITSDKCEYCGAVFYDFSAIDPTNEKPTYLKIKLPSGHYLMARAIVETISMYDDDYPQKLYIHDAYANTESYIDATPETKIEANFVLMRGSVIEGESE